MCESYLICVGYQQVYSKDLTSSIFEPPSPDNEIINVIEDGADNFRAATDNYLIVALETKEFLITNQKKDPQGKSEVTESIIH